MEVVQESVVGWARDEETVIDMAGQSGESFEEDLPAFGGRADANAQDFDGVC